MNRRSTLRFLFHTTGRTAGVIVLLLAVQAAISLCAVGYALQLRTIIDAAVAGSRHSFGVAVAMFAGLLCAQLLLRAVQRFFEEYSRSRLENRFKCFLYDQLLSRDYAGVAAVHSGEWVNRLTSDTVVVANGLTDILPGLSGMAVRLAGAVIMLLLLEPRFLYLVLPAGLLMVLFSAAFRQRMKMLHKDIQQKDGNLRVFLQDTLGSLLVIHSYALEQQAEDSAAVRMDEHRRARMHRSNFSNLCNLGFGAVMNGAYLLGAVLCGHGILTGTMTYGTFMAVLQLVGQVQIPFANISGFLPRTYAMLASAERLLAVESLPASKVGMVRSLEEVHSCYENEFEALGLWQAGFTYLPPVAAPEERNTKKGMSVVIHNLNLEVRKGQYLAFVGGSGFGKSTVLKLLLCLYPLDEGSRYLVCGGRKIPLDGSWQRLFAYVPQGNHLMSGTVRQIVTFADPAHAGDDARLQKALQVACADSFVAGLEKGVDTPLGERGMGLSEGQMQRLAIARAVFSKRPILMLDECTSALDAATEQQVLANLHRMTDKTVLIVTHRPEALKICDAVVEFSADGCTVHSLKKKGETL